MSQNNSMSFESNNEFIPNNQGNQGPSFDQFMKVCFSNPSFFESMKQFYVTQNSQRTFNEPSQSRVNEEKHQNLEQNNFEQSRYREQEMRQQVKEKEIKPLQEMKRKPANPLSKFLPNDSLPQQKPNQPYSKPSQPLKGQTFDEQPIKSSYTEALTSNNSGNFDFKAIKQNQSLQISNVPERKVLNFDDMPIKGVKEHQLDNYYKQEKDDKGPSSSSIYDMDERPLTGCANKDFKELIKEKFPNSMVPDEEDDEHENDHHQDKKGQRNFLKRGSRQHLSSALNRSKQPKDKNVSANKSELEEGNRSITPRRNLPEGRSTSQHRVLDKKNNSTSQRVIPKAPIYKNQKSFNEDVGSKARPPLSKTIKVDTKGDKPSNRMLNTSDLESKKKKTKNVFNDDSEQSSSDDQEIPYFKAVEKKKQKQPQQSVKKIQKSYQDDEDDFDDKTEVIEGVFLSQSQLDQILDKYGRVKEVIKEVVIENESQKVATLRKKYNQMIALIEEEKEQYQLSFQKEKEDFERYKSEQMNKIKNERRVMERQVKSGLGGGGHGLQKEKQELERLKQELQKEREDLKRKDKNNRIMLQKYKKQNDELKSKLQRLDYDRETQSIASKRSTAKLKSEDQDKLSVTKNKPRVKKSQQQEVKLEQVSYNDLKKKKDIDKKQIKSNFDYVEDDSRVKTKPVSITNQVKKKQNRWAFDQFQSSSEENDSENQQQEEEVNQVSDKSVEWNPSIKLSDLPKMDLSIRMVTDNMINTLFRHENNSEYVKYLKSLKSPSRTLVNSTRNGRNDYTVKLYSDRSKELIYDNGTRKVSFQNGYSIVYFRNEDIKQTLPDKTVLYYFKEKEVDQITLSNGINIYRFQNNQVQIHYENGYIEIRHSDGTIKVLGGQHTRR